MQRIPFGIKRLDNTIDGGAPRGSVVLLSGEAGAGAREFMYTSAVMNGLAQANDDLFDLHYGDLAPNATLPESIHYISFTNERDQIQAEIDMSMDDEVARRGFRPVEYLPLTTNYFHKSPVPRNWYAEQTVDIRSLRKRHEEREDLLSSLGDAVSERAMGSLVIIDSFSDLIAAIGGDIEWSDINYLAKGLAKAAHEWGALILIHVNHETLSSRQHGQLVDDCSGTLRFQWETGGSTRARTLVVKNFRGVLSQIEEENIVKFETDLGDAGFDISDVRKIR